MVVDFPVPYDTGPDSDSKKNEKDFVDKDGTPVGHKSIDPIFD